MEDAFNVTRAPCGNGRLGQHPNSPGRNPTKQEDAGSCHRPISILSFLEAENIRLRQIAIELRLDIIALRKNSQSPATLSNIVK